MAEYLILEIIGEIKIFLQRHNNSCYNRISCYVLYVSYCVCVCVLLFVSTFFRVFRTIKMQLAAPTLPPLSWNKSPAEINLPHSAWQGSSFCRLILASRWCYDEIIRMLSPSPPDYNDGLFLRSRLIPVQGLVNYEAYGNPEPRLVWGSGSPCCLILIFKRQRRQNLC